MLGEKTVIVPPRCATPVVSREGTSMRLAMKCGTLNSQIFYSLNKPGPPTKDSSKYMATNKPEIPQAEDKYTVQAVAYKTGLFPSSICTFEVSIEQLPRPVIHVKKTESLHGDLECHVSFRLEGDEVDRIDPPQVSLYAWHVPDDANECAGLDICVCVLDTLFACAHARLLAVGPHAYRSRIRQECLLTA